MNKSILYAVGITLGVLIVATRTDLGRELFQGQKKYF